MPHEDTGVGYLIWGVDHAVYGPVELPALITWIKDERVMSDTWIFLERSDCWEKAAQVPELQMFFHAHPPAAPGSATRSATGSVSDALSPAALRHVKLLSSLNDDQLERFLQLMAVENVAAGNLVVKQGEPANAMYLLVEGELRVRMIVDERETSLGNLNAGEFFSEICLFDHGPRSADVIASQDSTLLRIAAADFERFARETPDLAAPFLFALAKTLACRFRADHRRYRDSVSFIHPAPR